MVVVLAAVLGPKGPTGPPDPTLAGANPRPEWPFLWLFALLSLSPPAAETFIILVFPVILIVALFLVPFVSNRGERAPSRRPVAVLAVVVIYTVARRPDLSGSDLALVAADDRLERRADPGRHRSQTAARCNCKGPWCSRTRTAATATPWKAAAARAGPDLTGVGTRLTPGQLIDQVSNGTPGRRQHAGVRQANQPGRDDGPG